MLTLEEVFVAALMLVVIVGIALAMNKYVPDPDTNEEAD